MSRASPSSALSPVILAAAVAVVLAGFWLRIQRLDAFPPGLSNDEAINLIDSAHIAQTGKIAFYQEIGRPEPLYQVFGGLTSLFFGNSVWVFRFASALWGLLTLPAVFWASRQCFAGQPPALSALLGLLALIVVATALGHVAISRSLYRAAPLTFFLAMLIGFASRAFRLNARSDYALAAVFAALAIYCYSSALVAPFAFIPVALLLAAVHRRDWRRWLPGLALFGLVLLLLTAPVAYLLMKSPSAILARAQNVAPDADASLGKALEQMLAQFFLRGDENPQYNAAEAPLVAPLVAPLFLLGFFCLLLRLRQPSAVLLLALLLLNAAPVLFTNEITHGLRIFGEFAVIPLVAAGGLIPVFHLLMALKLSEGLGGAAILLALLALFAIFTFRSWRAYTDYWQAASGRGLIWRMYDRDLSLGEWFFRSDLRFLGEWLAAQERTLLIPAEALNGRALRANLMARYPYTRAASAAELPADTVVVLPWALERGDFFDEAAQYALLAGDTATLLPPFRAEFLPRLLQNRGSSLRLEGESSGIPLVAEYFPLGSALTPVYQIGASAGPPIARFNGELELRGFSGPDAIAEAGKYQYSLQWSVAKPASHRYGAFLQLRTPEWDLVAGDERLLHRWLYPTIIWRVGDRASVIFELELERPLAPGAYRLAAGAWYVNGGRMRAESFVGAAIPTAATIGWIKAPQTNPPIVPPDAIPVDVIFADSFTLTHAQAQRQDSNLVALKTYWRAPMERVDLEATAFVHAMDAGGQLLAQSDKAPWSGQYPTQIWDGGETVVIEHRLRLDAVDGVRLYTGLYAQADLTRLEAWKDGARVVDDRVYLGNLAALLKPE